MLQIIIIIKSEKKKNPHGEMSVFFGYIFFHDVDQCWHRSVWFDMLFQTLFSCKWLDHTCKASKAQESPVSNLPLLPKECKDKYDSLVINYALKSFDR